MIIFSHYNPYNKCNKLSEQPSECIHFFNARELEHKRVLFLRTELIFLVSVLNTGHWYV